MIFDEKGNVLENPDLALGHVEEKAINVTHAYTIDTEEQGEWVTIAEYPETGGKEVEWKVTRPEEGHWETRGEDGEIVERFDGTIPDDAPRDQTIRDEWRYLVYMPYTEEELAEMEAEKAEMEFQTRIAAQMPVALSMFVMAANLPDEQALQVEALYPEWAAGESYKVGDIRRFNDDLYRCLFENTAAEEHAPDVNVAQWKKILPPEEPGGYLPWVQPLGYSDAYNKGDRVTHEDKVWESTCDGNTWEPGVYGWAEIEGVNENG